MRFRHETGSDQFITLDYGSLLLESYQSYRRLTVYKQHKHVIWERQSKFDLSELLPCIFEFRPAPDKNEYICQSSSTFKISHSRGNTMLPATSNLVLCHCIMSNYNKSQMSHWWQSCRKWGLKDDKCILNFKANIYTVFLNICIKVEPSPLINNVIR